MFDMDQKALSKLGAQITTREIKQQPALWQETFAIYQKKLNEINHFLKTIISAHEKVRVIFTGAGTSAYVGNTLVPYLTKAGDSEHFIFESIATTDVVASPDRYLKPETPTILVSFARSGNSPESVTAVHLADQLISHLWKITITCAEQGRLAQESVADPKNLLLLMPPLSNDQGFAMTGSFTCMTLAALLVFDTSANDQKEQWIHSISKMGHEVVSREEEIQSIVNEHFNRLVYLGSGSLAGLVREAQLKVLELTAGKIAPLYDSSMGFRHGPKSFVDEHTLVFDFINNNNYTRQYDIDVMEEIKNDQIARRVVAIGVKKETNFRGENFFFSNGDADLPDGYLALPDIMFAQTLALLTAVKLHNLPDTPSPSGTVNRVVKGVKIHTYSKS
ncbi:MAG: SIS domain-containing protein [Sporolactobacillus sp.]|jgi:tagatose-6-phosphate ketose/aldose isomerase|nr:SIS domain-containing protein [Sporolactobacillus sp.]